MSEVRGDGAPAGVHQFVPMLHVGDAVGQHTLSLQRLLLERGVDSRIYVEHGDPDTTELTSAAADYPRAAGTGDVLVYQFATASDLVPWLIARPERLVVNYHNVTPPGLVAAWDNPLARHQVRARQELTALAGRAALGVAVSEFNRKDLDAAGFAASEVVPPIVPAGVATAGRPAREAVEGATGARWLAVGRLAPNKAVEDAVAGLLAYRIRHDPQATLVVVGRPAVGSYARALHAYAAELGLAGAVRFAGRLDDDALHAAYAGSDVLVVTSEHEGYCLPVVEAMAHDLPVVAYRQGAVPEVLGGAGVLVDRKDPLTLAAAVHQVVADPARRRAVVEAGRRRLADLDLDGAGERLVELLLAVRDGRLAEAAPTAPTA